MVILRRRDPRGHFKLCLCDQRLVAGHIREIDLRLRVLADAGPPQIVELLGHGTLRAGGLDTLRSEVVCIEVIIRHAVLLRVLRPLVYILVVYLQGVLGAEAVLVGLAVRGVLILSGRKVTFHSGTEHVFLRDGVFLDAGHDGLQLSRLLLFLTVGQLRGRLHLADLLPEVRAGGLLLVPPAAHHAGCHVAGVLGILQFVGLIVKVTAYAVTAHGVHREGLFKHTALGLRCQLRQEEIAQYAAVLIQHIVQLFRRDAQRLAHGLGEHVRTAVVALAGCVVLQALALNVSAVPRPAGAVRVEELRVDERGEYIAGQRVRRCHLVAHGVDGGENVHVLPPHRIRHTVRRDAQQGQLAPLRDLQPVAVAQLEHIVRVLVAVPQIVPLVIVMVQQRVQQGRSDAQRHGPRRQLGPLLRAFGLRYPPDELVKALHAGVQEGHIVGVQHLAQRAGTPEVHGDIGGSIERIRLDGEVAYGFAALLRCLRFLHDAHKLRQTRGLFRGHVQRLHSRHHLAHPALRLLDGAGGVVEHGGVDAAQRLVELPVFPVVLYLRQRPRIVPRKRRSVPRIQSRSLQVSDHVPGKERGVVARYQRLEQVVGAAGHARQLVALRRIRRQRFHGVEQRVVHRHFPQLAIHIGRDDLVLAGPFDGGIVQCLRVELMLVLARLLDVAVYRVRVARPEIVAQQAVREAVFTALTHDLHRLLAQRFMQRHQAFRAALCAAHRLADTHRVQIPAPARGVLVLHAHGGHIVGIELLEEVRVLLCHKPAVHPVLHHVVDVLPYLRLVLRELRVLRQQLLGAGPAVLCGKFIVEHRLVLDGLGLVQIPQQPLPLTRQRRDVRIRILRQPVELGGGVRPNIRVLGVEVAQRRFRLQHLFRLALGQAHAVDVVQVEHIELEVVVEVLPSCADGREHIVEAVPHLPAPHVRLGIRDHVHPGRGRRPCLVVELI